MRLKLFLCSTCRLEGRTTSSWIYARFSLSSDEFNDRGAPPSSKTQTRPVDGPPQCPTPRHQAVSPFSQSHVRPQDGLAAFLHTSDVRPWRRPGHWVDGRAAETNNSDRSKCESALLEVPCSQQITKTSNETNNMFSSLLLSGLFLAHFWLCVRHETLRCCWRDAESWNTLTADRTCSQEDFLIDRYHWLCSSCPDPSIMWTRKGSTGGTHCVMSWDTPRF